MSSARNLTKPHAGDAKADRNRPTDVDRSARAAPSRRRLRRRACAALAAVLAIGVTAPAQADPFGLDTPILNVEGVGAIPDNFAHTYCFDGGGWTTAWRNVVHTQMANLDAQTSYWDQFPLPNDCRQNTDLWFRLDDLSDLDPPLRGDYDCDLWNNGVDGVPNSGDDRCESAIIRLSTHLTDDHQRRKTACHEIGHSVGLAHGIFGGSPPKYANEYYDDCMRTGPVPAGEQWESYNAHHIAHANSRTPSGSVPSEGP